MNTTTTKSTVPVGIASCGTSPWQRMLAVVGILMTFHLLEIERFFNPTLPEISKAQDSTGTRNSNNHSMITNTITGTGNVSQLRGNDNSTDHSRSGMFTTQKRDGWTIIRDSPSAEIIATTSTTAASSSTKSGTATQMTATTATAVPTVTVTTNETDATKPESESNSDAPTTATPVIEGPDDTVTTNETDATKPESESNSDAPTTATLVTEGPDNHTAPLSTAEAASQEAAPTQPVPRSPAPAPAPAIVVPDHNMLSGYLQYLSISGWSNQVFCMQHAYLVAKATNRTLITAPVLPHYFLYGSSLKQGGQRNSHTYRLDLSLPQQYLHRLKSNEYLDLETVLDMEYTFAGVPTVDFRHFMHKVYDEDQMSQWVIESEYSRYNTLFTKNRPDLEGTTSSGEHNVVEVLHDWTQIAANHSSYPLWTLLDSFSIKFHASVTENDTPFHIRFSHVIRQTAKNIHQHVWGNVPYASVHIRVGDGSFVEHVHETWDIVSDASVWHLQEWIQSQREAPPKVGIFVATDMKAGEQVQFTKILQSKMPQNIAVEIWYSDMFADYTKSLQPTLVYPGIFLDQQLAACASIGFTPSLVVNSTFSMVIDMVRQSPGSCDL
ncbi:expressed unknown protein [Seminavis robusta]|uniref:O-fucosyltransferase family protein n=1 Tax=Seminavis robusta TaxID=568900 RepID=A0A9N8EVV1_9STRA|nr:expressed unknown protein [Seminavis robusta]|eukprot:Sro2404_g326450.1 n/a (608) ;mRNA; r:7539-9362